MPANHLFSSKVIHKIWHSISIICVHYEMLHEGDILVLYMQYTQCNHSWLISSKCMAFLSYPPATTLDFPKLTLPWSATPQAEHHATSCMYDLVYLLTSFLQMKDIYKVRYKTCTLDSGLEYGLDSIQQNHPCVSELTRPFHRSVLIASSPVPKFRIMHMQIPFLLFFFISIDVSI